MLLFNFDLFIHAMPACIPEQQAPTETFNKLRSVRYGKHKQFKHPTERLLNGARTPNMYL